jgi:hypothetical protein
MTFFKGVWSTNNPANCVDMGEHGCFPPLKEWHMQKGCIYFSSLEGWKQHQVYNISKRLHFNPSLLI